MTGRGMGGWTVARKGLVCAIAMLLLATGCSRLSLVHSFAESALVDAAEDHLDLDDEGRALVDREVEALLAWHDAEMLPRYARFMSAQADLLEGGAVDRETVADAVKTLRRMLDTLVQGAAPQVAKVLADHTEPDKLRYLETRMTERLEGRRNELDEPEETRLAERIEKVTDNFERLTGDLEANQISVIRQ